MHLHGISVNPNLGGLEAADAAQRLVSAQRATDVRKKLANPLQLEAEASFESLVLLSGSDQRERQQGRGSDETAAQEKPHPEANSEDSDPDHHWSYWA